MSKNGSGFVIALLVSGLNVALAILFSGSGYEALITISIAMGILFTLLSANIIRLIFKNKTWLIAKILAAPLIILPWLVVIAAVILTASQTVRGSDAHPPDVNWWLVLAGATPYLLPKLNTSSPNSSLKQSLLGWVTAIYSVAILLVAAIDFHVAYTLRRNLTLVIAVQLQYLMAYAVLRTGYMDRSVAFANRLAARLRLTDADLGPYLVIAVVGLPLIVPIMLIMATSIINQ